jgi:hypothetical protein
MAEQKKDLFDLLNAYAVRQNSPTVSLDQFLNFLKKSAKKNPASQLGIWLQQSDQIFNDELDELIGEKKVHLVEGDRQKLYLPLFYYEKIINAYKTVDDTVESPFPSETSLALYNMPAEGIRYVDAANGLTSYLTEKNHKEHEIVRIGFAEGNGNCLALPALLPESMLSIALYKIRDYSRRYANTDYLQQKLCASFPGKEMITKDMYKRLIGQTEELLGTMMEGGEFSTSFWYFFGTLLKREIDESVERNEERLPRDIALGQSIAIVNACNNYFRVIALNEKDKSQAYTSLDAKLEEPPYYFTFDEIFQFKAKSGQLILEGYTKNDLTAYIKDRQRPGENGEMPALLTIRTRTGETLYVKKANVLVLCKVIITDTATMIRSRLENRWLEMLRNYHFEAAMRDSFAFEELLNAMIEENMPQVIPLIRDQKIDFAQEELKTKLGGKWDGLSVFENGEPVPFRVLLGLQKEAILSVIRMHLPFWYSLSFVVKIIGLIKHGAKREIVFEKSAKKKKLPQNAAPAAKSGAVDSILKDMVGSGSSLDERLDELAENWNMLLNRSAQNKMREDVNAAIKSHCRFMQKTLNMSRITRHVLEDSAQGLINSNLVLSKIQSKKALAEYIVLMMLKFMK